jgi:hypothetical protein
VPHMALAAGSRRRRAVNVNKALTLAARAPPPNVTAMMSTGCRLGSLLNKGGEGM